MAVSFIGGGIRRKPPACRKSLTNSSILITIISWDYLNLSLANEYVSDVTIPSYVIKYYQCCSRRISQSNVERHFQQHFSYIMAVSFIGGGIRRKPPACRKSLTNFIT
jgi:hypothetical protein